MNRKPEIICDFNNSSWHKDVNIWRFVDKEVWRVTQIQNSTRRKSWEGHTWEVHPFLSEEGLCLTPEVLWKLLGNLRMQFSLIFFFIKLHIIYTSRFQHVEASLLSIPKLWVERNPAGVAKARAGGRGPSCLLGPRAGPGALAHVLPGACFSLVVLHVSWELLLKWGFLAQFSLMPLLLRV